MAKFGLIEHQHTGKLRHHRHTSFPALVLLVLLTGVFVMSLTSNAHADPPPITHSYTVTAVIPGDIPTQAPVITTPIEGKEFSSIPIAVSGTCPAYTLIKVFRNNVFGASTNCGGSGSFNVTMDLFEGDNALLARAYNYLDQPGPDSTIVNVTYTPPVTSGGGSGNSGSGGGSGSGSSGSGGSHSTPKQLILTSDVAYQGVTVGEELSYPVQLIGGRPPYAVSVDWGDGTTTTYKPNVAGVFTIKHTYTKAGFGSKYTYGVILTATDNSGQRATLQIFVIVSPKASFPASVSPNETPPGRTYAVLSIVALAIVLILVMSFWTGELWAKHSMGIPIFPHRHNPTNHQAV